MNTKIIFAAFALALSVAAVSTTAHAGGPGSFNSGGNGPDKPGPGNWGGPGGLAPNPGGGGSGGWGGGFGTGFGIVINPGRGYARRDDRISCRTGRRIVGRSGFNRVRVIECRGDTYTYRAKRGSRQFRVSVDAYDGVIVGRSRL